MRRLSFLIALLVLVIASNPGAAAGPATANAGADDIELIARNLESLYVELTGTAPESPQIQRLGNQRYAMTVQLPAQRAAAGGVRGFQVLAVGHQGSTPTNPRYLFNPALVSTRAVLNFWWAVNNGTAEVRTAATTLKVKGAGRTFLSQTEDIDYPAGALTIYWEGTNQALELDGLYTIIAKVSGGGGRKTSFIAR